MMWRTLFITLHAAFASIALLAGLVGGRRPGWFAVYYWSLVLMLAFLVLAVAADWRGRQPGTHIIVGALVALGGFMVWKAERARRVRLSPQFVDHLGFTLVGLVDAFVVVTVFNLGWAIWLVTAIGVAIALAGHAVIGAVKRRRARFGLLGAHSPIFETQRAQKGS